MNFYEIPYGKDVQKYEEILKKTFHPRLIILHGSVAKGSFGLGSDIDILMVAENLPNNLNERLKLLYALDRTHAPIDIKAYTPEEIRKMLIKGHPLLMDALADGKVLYADEDCLEELMRMFKTAKRKFRRFERGWIKVKG